MTIERIKWLDDIIENVKKVARLNDSPMAYFKNDKNELTLSVIAVSGNCQQRLALWTLMQTTQAKEIIYVIDAWRVTAEKIEDFDIRPRDNPKRKDCFIINYFTKDKNYTTILDYEKDGKKIKWEREMNYYDKKGIMENSFNPYNFTEEEIKNLGNLAEREIIKENGKTETIDLPFFHQIKIYRKDGKVFFEAFNKDKIFGKSEIMNDDEEFKNKLEQTIYMIKKVGEIMEKK